MGQQEVLRVLANNKSYWFTSDELVHLTSCSRHNINRSCRSLCSFGFAVWKKRGLNKNDGYLYRFNEVVK